MTGHELDACRICGIRQPSRIAQRGRDRLLDENGLYTGPDRPDSNFFVETGWDRHNHRIETLLAKHRLVVLIKRHTAAAANGCEAGSIDVTDRDEVDALHFT